MYRAFLFVALFLLLIPSGARAATKAAHFEVSGWIPYWREATGTADVLPHLQNFTTLMPFGYIMQNDGSIHDAFGFSATTSTSTAAVLVANARAAKVNIIPTVMWGNGAATDKILRSASRRIALEKD
ncbi:MAG: hypothetical protein KGI71_03825, partial [Patescibacteria group bacterium]|nr:hypothetical protein [Patescibacteria group bacterium]